MVNWFQPVRPPAFSPTLSIAGCYCVCGKQVLFLKRNLQKDYGGTWGVPAGKQEKDEDPQSCVIREVYEETSIDIGGKDLFQIGTLYCRIPSLDYTYNLFYKSFNTKPSIALALAEHTEYRWTTLEEALALPLIIGGAESLLFFNERQKVL